MALTRAAKETLKEQVAKRFEKVNAAIVAEYRGLTMAELTELRTKLREANAEFRVVKNRVAKVAIKESAPHAESIAPNLRGPVGVVFIYGDPAAAAKSVLEFEKEKEKFKVTGGMMEGKALSQAELKAIADLPPKDVLVAKIIGTLVAPHRGLIGVLNGVPSALVRVLAAIKDKKQG